MQQNLPVPMLRPRVKPEHAPYRIAEGKIRIGGVSYGLAAEISDPDGWVWTMLAAMDGSRGLAEIIGQVHAAHPEVEICWYDAGHAFNNDTRASYNAEAAKEAMARTLAFFNRHL